MPSAGFAAHREENLSRAMPPIAKISFAVHLAPGSPTVYAARIDAGVPPPVKRTFKTKAHANHLRVRCLSFNRLYLTAVSLIPDP
jgi:hypothetical protein